MKDEVRAPEMTALLGAVLAAQWFSSTGSGFLEACGNAVVLPLLLCGLALAALAAGLGALAPRRGLWESCRGTPGLGLFPLIGALLFTLLAATALRDALDVLTLFLLPQTPRWFLLLLLLPLLLCMALQGSAAVSRVVRLLGPALLTIYAAVLLFSSWNRADVYNFFPLLGRDVPALLRTALSGLSVGAWLPMLWVDAPRLAPLPRTARRGCLLGCALCTAGYLTYGLIFPNGAAQGTAFPLHQLSASGGFSSALQRTHALFIFAWLPVQAAAVGAGLTYAGRSLRAVFPKASARLLALLPLLAALALGFPALADSPAWLLYLLQTNVQAYLALLLLVPLLICGLRERRARHA